MNLKKNGKYILGSDEYVCMYNYNRLWCNNSK